MKIKIYQIDMERDEHRIAMMGYEDTLARMNGDAIDSSLYDLVFDGGSFVMDGKGKLFAQASGQEFSNDRAILS